MININISINSSKQMASENLLSYIDSLKYDITFKLIVMIMCHRSIPNLILKSGKIGRETILDMGKDIKFSFVRFKPYEWRKRFRVNHGDITLKGAIQRFLDELPNCIPTIIYCKSVDCFVLLGLQMNLFKEDTIIDDTIIQSYYVDNGKSIFSKFTLTGEMIEYSIEQIRSPEEKSTCEACEKRKFLKMKFCTRCRKVRYCDKKCQKGHWKEHKKVCNK